MPKKKVRTPPKVRVTEFRFRIDAFTPETIPMARLAEYMKHVAEILGETTLVHFSHLEGGSTVLVNRIQNEAVPKIRDRAAAIARREAPRDAIASFHHVNRMLREDNAAAVLRERKRGPTILIFPGREESQLQVSSVRQHATLEGELLRVGGKGERVPILLQSEGMEIAGVWSDRPTAKRLAGHLFEPVRLSGEGRWSRDVMGTWILNDFHVASYQVLENLGLAKTVQRLREAGGDWTAEAFADLQRIRHGSPEAADGGH
jgi:hypothetical protein